MLCSGSFVLVSVHSSFRVRRLFDSRYVLVHYLLRELVPEFMMMFVLVVC